MYVCAVLMTPIFFAVLSLGRYVISYIHTYLAAHVSGYP